MQSTTGCKINVSPATGQDFEREIGLVGSRDSIERAKHAIMEKVHAVVCLLILLTSLNSNHPSNSFHSKRKTVAAAEPQITKINTTIPHPSRNLNSNISNSNRMVSNRIRTSNSPAALVEERTPMQHMAAMRTMSLSGILAIKPRIKASKIPKPKVPQARDVKYVRDSDMCETYENAKRCRVKR